MTKKWQHNYFNLDVSAQDFPKSGIYSDTLSGLYAGILILSGIYSGILSGIYSGTLSSILSDILSGIFSGILSGILSGI
jgi:hypothetical protein